MRGLCFLLIAIAGVASTQAGASDRAGDVLERDCDDTVVIGRLKNDEDSYEHVEIEGDLLGHGWMSAEVRVERLIAGPPIGRDVRARYFGHTYRIEDRDFLIVLKPHGGAFTASGFILLDSQKLPTIRSTCVQSRK